MQYPVLEPATKQPVRIVRPQPKPQAQIQQKTQQQPIFVAVHPQQVIAQPQVVYKRVVQRPLTLDEKIVKSKENVDYEVKRLYYCSYLFIPFGLLCIFIGFKEMFDARLKATFVVQEKQIPWGNPNYTGFQWTNVTIPENRLEKVFYDAIWNTSFLTVIVSFLLFTMGRTALRATEKQKSRVAERMFNRHFFLFLTFLVFYVFTRKQSRVFKSTFEWYKAQNISSEAFNNGSITELIEMPKRNLAARPAYSYNFNNLYHQHQKMFDEADAEFDRAFAQPIPEELKSAVKKMRHHHSSRKQNFQKFKFDNADDVEDADSGEQEFDFKKEMYRIYAPNLYEHALAAEARLGHHHHGPTVQADKKNAVKDWPKLNNMCPVMLFFIFACIHQICRLKFLEKELAKLEFLQKAKKMVKKASKKQTVVAPSQQSTVVPQQPVQASTLAPQHVQVFPKMPVAQKKCKKVAKVVQPQPQLIMPVFEKKIEDVEAIPQVNESFDYSLTDPLVDEITAATGADAFSSTGVSSSKNSMM